MKTNTEMAWEVWCYVCGALAFGVLVMMGLAEIVRFITHLL